MADRHTEVKRSIAASADQVWALLTDAGSYGDWNPSVVSIKGPIELGKTIELISTVSPKRTFKLKVIDMNPPNTMRWADGMPLGLFKGVRTYRLDEQTDGTEFTMTEQFSGPLAGLICKSIPDLTESFDQFADGLKAAAEKVA